jgi:hypothetical protein
MTSCGLGRRKEGSRHISSRPRTHMCAARADSLRRPRQQSVRYADGPPPPGADGPLFASEHLVPPLFPTSRADSPPRPGGRSARSVWTVRPTAADSLTFLLIFSLIYSR